MIVESYTINNGYRCACCSNTFEDYQWIKEEKMKDFDEIFNMALSDDVEGKVSVMYEKEGKTLYGFKKQFGKQYLESFIYIGKQEYCVLAEGSDKKTFSKKEIELLWEEFKLEFPLEELLSFKFQFNM